MSLYMARTNARQCGTSGVLDSKAILHVVAIVRRPVYGSVVNETSSDGERNHCFLGQRQLRGVFSVDLRDQATHDVGWLVAGGHSTVY